MPTDGVKEAVGMMVAEAVMDHVARKLGLSSLLVRERNLYTEGDLTP